MAVINRKGSSNGNYYKVAVIKRTKTRVVVAVINTRRCPYVDFNRHYLTSEIDVGMSPCINYRHTTTLVLCLFIAAILTFSLSFKILVYYIYGDFNRVQLNSNYKLPW